MHLFAKTLIVLPCFEMMLFDTLKKNTMVACEFAFSSPGVCTARAQKQHSRQAKRLDMRSDDSSAVPSKPRAAVHAKRVWCLGCISRNIVLELTHGKVEI